MRALLAPLAVALACTLSACSLSFDATTLGVPATLAAAAGQAPAGDRFSVSSKAVFGLWGIARIREPSLRKALASQLAGGTGVSDLRIRVRSRWNDVVFTVLTAGLIVPRTVTFDGVVTR